MIESQCAIKAINAMFGPRTLEGWGITHVCGWLIQETPDDLVSYITLMPRLYEVLRYDLAKKKIGVALDTTLNQELKNATNVHAQGVENRTSAVLAKLKEGMVAKCDSKIFKQALEAGITPPV
jgi:hypothetical protein